MVQFIDVRSTNNIAATPVKSDKWYLLFSVSYLFPVKMKGPFKRCTHHQYSVAFTWHFLNIFILANEKLVIKTNVRLCSKTKLVYFLSFKQQDTQVWLETFEYNGNLDVERWIASRNSSNRSGVNWAYKWWCWHTLCRNGPS